MMPCYQCSKEVELSVGQKIVRSEECPYCFASLHVCKMCKHYDVHSYNECKEPIAERIVEKDKANYCDYFILHDQGSSGDKKDDFLAAANALFKK